MVLKSTRFWELSSRNMREIFMIVLLSTFAMSINSNSNGEHHEVGSVRYPLTPQSGLFAGELKRPALWQLPDGPVEKVLVIYTPSGFRPENYWDYSPSCPYCKGEAYPEHRHIMADALSAGYAVFVPDSITGEWEHWPEDNPDVILTLYMITEWKNMLGFQDLPTVAVGASAGGLTLSVAALRPGFFDAICFMISGGVTAAFDEATHEYPPTIFVLASRHTSESKQVGYARKTLESEGVPTAQLTYYPQPLTPEYFSNAILYVDLALSTSIFEHIKQDGYLDEGNCLKSNPKSLEDQWTESILGWDIIPQSTQPDFPNLFINAIFSEVRLAYAFHAATSHFDTEVFAFLDAHKAQDEPAVSLS